jgi:beta-lactamase class A
MPYLTSRHSLFSRRQFLLGTSTLGTTLALFRCTPKGTITQGRARDASVSERARVVYDVALELAQLERNSGGRLCVAILDTASGVLQGHRMDERVGMCSTFKLLLAGIILREGDQGRLQLDQAVPFTEADMVSTSPITKMHVGTGSMSVRALAEATETTSDNTAANLLLKLVGGPIGLTAKLRELGDLTTRIDRNEPEMNRVLAGDPRDTTTPRAMAETAARLLTSDLLSPAARAELLGWMQATKTGAKRLRAGFPVGLRAGDKTGTGMAEGMPDRYNDVAIVWPPGKPPLLIAAYYESPVHSDDMRDEDQAVLASVGRIATLGF